METGFKIWKWMVGLLALFNILLIITIWVKPSQVQPAPPPQMERNMVFHELHLTSEQQEKVEILNKEHRKKIDSLKRLAKDTREAYFRTITTDSIPSDSLTARLGILHQLIEQQTYRHFHDIRLLLNEKQRIVFDAFVGNIIRSLQEQPRFKGDGMRPAGPAMGPPPEDNDNRRHNRPMPGEHDDAPAPPPGPSNP